MTKEDLSILLRADEILADASKWDRQDDRVCHQEDTTWSLFCALQKASIEVLGEYQHRRVALQEVRFAVEEATKGMELEHRLMDFNNLPATRFEDVKRVLAVAIDRVRQRLQEATPPVNGWKGIDALEPRKPGNAGVPAGLRGEPVRPTKPQPWLLIRRDGRRSNPRPAAPVPRTLLVPGSAGSICLFLQRNR